MTPKGEAPATARTPLQSAVKPSFFMMSPKLTSGNTEISGDRSAPRKRGVVRAQEAGPHKPPATVPKEELYSARSFRTTSAASTCQESTASTMSSPPAAVGGRKSYTYLEECSATTLSSPIDAKDADSFAVPSGFTNDGCRRATSRSRTSSCSSLTSPSAARGVGRGVRGPAMQIASRDNSDIGERRVEQFDLTVCDSPAFVVRSLCDEGEVVPRPSLAGPRPSLAGPRPHVGPRNSEICGRPSVAARPSVACTAGTADLNGGPSAISSVAQTLQEAAVALRLLVSTPNLAYVDPASTAALAEEAAYTVCNPAGSGSTSPESIESQVQRLERQNAQLQKEHGDLSRKVVELEGDKADFNENIFDLMNLISKMGQVEGLPQIDATSACNISRISDAISLKRTASDASLDRRSRTGDVSRLSTAESDGLTGVTLGARLVNRACGEAGLRLTQGADSTVSSIAVRSRTTSDDGDGDLHASLRHHLKALSAISRELRDDSRARVSSSVGSADLGATDLSLLRDDTSESVHPDMDRILQDWLETPRQADSDTDASLHARPFLEHRERTKMLEERNRSLEDQVRRLEEENRFLRQAAPGNMATPTKKHDTLQEASTSPTVEDRSCAGSEALRGSVGVAAELEDTRTTHADNCSTEIAKSIYAPRDLVRNDFERDAAVLSVAPVQGCTVACETVASVANSSPAVAALRSLAVARMTPRGSSGTSVSAASCGGRVVEGSAVSVEPALIESEAAPLSTEAIAAPSSPRTDQEATAALGSCVVADTPPGVQLEEATPGRCDVSSNTSVDRTELPEGGDMSDVLVEISHPSPNVQGSVPSHSEHDDACETHDSVLEDAVERVGARQENTVCQQVEKNPSLASSCVSTENTLQMQDGSGQTSKTDSSIEKSATEECGLCRVHQSAQQEAGEKEEEEEDEEGEKEELALRVKQDVVQAGSCVQESQGHLSDQHKDVEDHHEQPKQPCQPVKHEQGCSMNAEAASAKNIDAESMKVEGDDTDKFQSKILCQQPVLSLGQQQVNLLPAAKCEVFSMSDDGGEQDDSDDEEVW